VGEKRPDAWGDEPGELAQALGDRTELLDNRRGGDDDGDDLDGASPERHVRDGDLARLEDVSRVQ
jgi:hypothetical protein